MTRTNNLWLRWWPALILAGLVPLVAYIFVVLALVEWQAHEAAEQGLAREATDGAADIARLVTSQISLLEGIAQHEALDSGEPASVRNYLERILAQHPEWVTIVLTDRERQVLNLRFPPGSELPALREQASLEAAWSMRRTVVGNLAYGTVAIRTPVVRGADTVYTFAVPLKPTIISDVLRGLSLPPGWSAVVVDGNDSVIGHSTDPDAHVGQRIAGIDRAALPGEGARIRRIATIAGSDAYAVFAPIAGTQWLFGVQLPVAAVEAPYESIRLALKLGAAVAILSTLLMLGMIILRSRYAVELRQRFMQAQVAKAHSETQERGLLLSSMSHELRTPLNAVIGFADLMRQQPFGPLGDRRYAEYATIIAESGGYILSMINDLLDMAKGEALEIRIEPERMNLAEASSDVLKLVKGLALLSKVKLVNDTPASVFAWADRRAVKHMLLNLISNAIKFAPEGQVTVSATASADGVRLVVRDDGIGMSPDEIELALQPFKQIDSPIGRQHRGTGLGLPLVKRLAEQHGGRLDIESVKGRGTTITIMLPQPAAS